MYNALLWQQILQNIIFELDCKKMLEIYNKLEYEDSTIIMIDCRDILMRCNNFKVNFIRQQINENNVLKIEPIIESVKILNH